MSILLQNYIATLLSDLGDSSFLNLCVKNSSNVYSAQKLEAATSIAYGFVISDMLLYVGMLAVTVVLSNNYRKYAKPVLASILLRISSLFLYSSFLINAVVLISNVEYLCSHSIYLFGNAYSFSFFSQATKLIMLVVAGSLYSLTAGIRRSAVQSPELILLIQISLALCSTIISSSNFALLLLALEGFSLILYVMTALGRTYGGVTASVKYFAFGTLGSIFLFWGVVHLYALAPSLSFDVAAAMQQSNNETSNFNESLEFATTAIAFGFMLKIGAAPVHQWVSDVYAGSHMYVTAFFSIFVKLILFMVFVRLALFFNCDSLLKLFVMSSLVIGCFMSLRQSEVKRLLAYSSIVHVGFLLMGDAISSATYLLTYVISSLLLFSVLLNTELGGKEITYLNELRFVRKSGYMQILYLVIALASSAGLPPFAGFYGKFLVWSSLIEDIYLTNDVYSYAVLTLSIAISLITIFYYMRVIAYLFIGDDGENKGTDVMKAVQSNTVSYDNIASLQPVLCILIAGWTFLHGPILTAVQQASISI